MDSLTPSDGPPPLARGVLDSSISARFEEVAAAVPGHVAIRTPGGEITYARLHELSDRLARGLLAELGSRRHPPPVPVATLLPQGIRAIAAQLAILKAGCFYVPLDPRYPAAALVAHVQPALVVVEAAAAGTAAGAAVGGVAIVDVDTLESRAYGPSTVAGPDDDGAARCIHAPANGAVDADALAYVYCTSGSTGRPKGVADTHRNVLHNVLRYTTTLQIDHTDRLSLLQSPAFSGAVSSTWCALLNGATLCPYDVLADGPGALADWIADSGVTVYHSVPTLFRKLVAGRRPFPRMRIIRLEGDRALASDVALYKSHFSSRCTLVNGLGTTETGLVRQLFVGHHTVVAPGLLPVGHAVDEMDVTVVAPDGTPLPRGEVGQIAVRSRYLARGYWRDDALTRAKFTFAPSAPEHRVYRTGDLGRMRDDDCLEYLGRGDTLAKVRGRSIDLSLVEQMLTAHPAVRDAAVLTGMRDDGETEIVAFVAPVPDAPLSVSMLHSTLRAQASPIMIPAVISIRESLPLTPHGKLDRKVLVQWMSVAPPAAAEPRQERPYPQGAIEVQVIRIWEAVLERSPIGVDDDFADLGGDSLAAAELLSCIRRVFARDLPLDTLWLRGRTARALARLLLEDESDPVWEGPVAFKSEGSLPPLFCVPVAGGHLHFYDALARRIGRDRPVYGLPPQGTTGHRPAHTSVEAMAAFAIDQLRTIQPSGPYHLVGYCGGGTLAFEVARRQLRAQQARIDLLALVDSAAPGRWVGLGDDVRVLHQRFRLVQERAYAIVLDALRMPHLRTLEGVAESHRWALWNYRPQPLDGRVLLIDPADHAGARRAARGWRTLALAGVEVAQIPGRHGDLMKEPAVALVAARIDAGLASAAARTPEFRSRSE